MLQEKMQSQYDKIKIYDYRYEIIQNLLKLYTWNSKTFLTKENKEFQKLQVKSLQVLF